MKSIKPGRGPSGMNAIGSIFAVIFGVIWTAFTASMGAPILFSLFGVLFVGMGIVQTIYHLKNATGKNRFSSFDITDSSEESDPLQKKFFGEDASYFDAEPAKFCPYCGTAAQENFEYCTKCGKKLP